MVARINKELDQGHIDYETMVTQRQDVVAHLENIPNWNEPLVFLPELISR